jgi:hypothetical protein
MRTVALTAGDPTAHSHPQMATTHSSVSLFAAAVVRFWADEGQEAGSTPRE